jgi:methionyl-tRNA formyltransferase
LSLRLAFFGSPAFAVPALHALAGAGYDIAAVYCQPPRPAHRGQALTRCAVHEAAETLGLAVRTPARLKQVVAEHEAFAALSLDAAVVAAYGLILPQVMLDAPRRGCLNIHASLLPRWRGAAPIHRAIAAGDAESGITIMRMEAGLDTGPMLLRSPVPIGPRTTTPDLHDALAALGATLILRVLDEDTPAIPQPDLGVTYAAKLTREDGILDFTRDAASLDRQIRAMLPWPGCTAKLGGEPLKILAAEPVDGEGPPGTVLDDQFTVACGEGALRLERVQRPGRASTDGAAFLRGVSDWRTKDAVLF